MNVNGKILGIFLILVLLPTAFAGIQIQGTRIYNYSSPLVPVKNLPYTVKLLCLGNAVYKRYYYTDGTTSMHFVKNCIHNTVCMGGFCVEKPNRISICNLSISWNCQKRPLLLGTPYCKNGNLWQLYRDPYGRTYGIQIHNCFNGCANGYCMPEPVSSQLSYQPSRTYPRAAATPTVESRRYYCVGKQVWVEEHYCNNTVKRHYVKTCGAGEICYSGSCIGYGGTIQNDVDSIPPKATQSQQTYRTQQTRCTTGWICRDSKHAAYRYNNCNLGNIIYCQNGCSNGACVNIIGNNNTVTVNNRVNVTYNYTYNYYQRRYSTSNQYSSTRTQTLYREGWFCKDYYHKGYRTADGRWIAVRYCPRGCINGYCVMTSTFNPRRDP
ncbi:MAG: hypothetical protein J7J87_00955 [Candidatus Diapherotrites archaeon]|nr:hypothetical protein [Candidatus Diapherotrites archaeon]